MEKRDFKGIWIPREMIGVYGYRIATLISAIRFGAPLPDRDSVVRELKKNGHMTKDEVEPIMIKDILSAKSMGGFGVGDKECEWCSVKTVTLHQHHFPIKRCNGGVDTVNICPNCHQEYHSIESKFAVKFSDEVEMYFRDAEQI